MTVDVYDTYATTPSGALLHLDVFVPAGTTVDTVEQLVGELVGGIDPEIEAERCESRSSRLLPPNSSIAIDIRESGVSIIPARTRFRAAA